MHKSLQYVLWYHNLVSVPVVSQLHLWLHRLFLRQSVILVGRTCSCSTTPIIDVEGRHFTMVLYVAVTVFVVPRVYNNVSEHVWRTEVR